MDFDLKERLSRGAAFCGVPLGIGPVSWFGVPAPGEIATLTLSAVAFLGAGIWMFRQWSQSPAEQVLGEAALNEETTPRKDRELINA